MKNKIEYSICDQLIGLDKYVEEAKKDIACFYPLYTWLVKQNIWWINCCLPYWGIYKTLSRIGGNETYENIYACVWFGKIIKTYSYPLKVKGIKEKL